MPLKFGLSTSLSGGASAGDLCSIESTTIVARATRRHTSPSTSQASARTQQEVSEIQATSPQREQRWRGDAANVGVPLVVMTTVDLHELNLKDEHGVRRDPSVL
jgi:hypothetical protein